MILNEELLVKKILPIIRKYVILNCEKKGFRKTEIARRLGVTSAALTRYENRGCDLLSSDTWSEIYPDISKIAEYTCSLGYNYVNINKLLLEYWIKWNSRGIFCDEIFNLRRRFILIQNKEDFCEEIMKYYGRFLVDSALAEVQEAFENFRKIPYIANFIPEVSTNIVRIVEVGRNIYEYPIIGFPGRICVIKERLFTYAPPKIGGSKHMGEILRKLFTIDSRIHGLTGMKYDDRILDHLNYKWIRVKYYSSNSDDDLIKKISESADLVVDKGGLGREGFIYVTGIDSKNAVAKVREILTTLNYNTYY